MSTSPAYSLKFKSSQCETAQNFFLNLLRIVIEMTTFLSALNALQQRAIF